jgi:hypothetical protein
MASSSNICSDFFRASSCFKEERLMKHEEEEEEEEERVIGVEAKIKS